MRSLPSVCPCASSKVYDPLFNGDEIFLPSWSDSQQRLRWEDVLIELIPAPHYFVPYDLIESLYLIER